MQYLVQLFIELRYNFFFISPYLGIETCRSRKEIILTLPTNSFQQLTMSVLNKSNQGIRVSQKELPEKEAVEWVHGWWNNAARYSY